ncbi:MAG: hypothetical protein IPL71_01410 [Anaerolineales bacterium]|uniref:hypothetical protein n=1 Tax=Candidatus Villigracilis proximus TaxID=3140683 RepID=UPI00313494F7|nr:hypothetical protein [Anaerolineales bacterium]
MKNSVFSMLTDPQKLSRILWGAALLTLPVTSFRWFPFLGEGTLVRPLALYPLALLIPLLVIQSLRRKEKLNWAGALIPLGMLILFIVAATSFGALIDPIPLRGQIYSGRVIRALATLFIGVAFFISAIWMNKESDDFLFSVRWLLAGFVPRSGVERIASRHFLHRAAQ